MFYIIYSKIYIFLCFERFFYSIRKPLEGIHLKYKIFIVENRFSNVLKYVSNGNVYQILCYENRIYFFLRFLYSWFNFYSLYSFNFCYFIIMKEIFLTIGYSFRSVKTFWYFYKKALTTVVLIGTDGNLFSCLKHNYCWIVAKFRDIMNLFVTFYSI